MLTKILIEPVFKNKDLIKVLPELKHMASHLITQSAVLSEFSIQVAHIEGELIKQFELKQIRIINKTIKYEQTFGSECVKIDKQCEIINVKMFFAVFPTPGIYWLELETNPQSIETQQRMLDGTPTRGWSEHELDFWREPKKYFLRQPILVIDSAIVNQIKLNKRLTILTWIIVILTILLLAIGALQFI